MKVTELPLGEWKDLGFARKTVNLLSERMKAARNVGATWSGSYGESFLLVGVSDSARVSFARHGASVRIVFGEENIPACTVEIWTDGMISCFSTDVSREEVNHRLATAGLRTVAPSARTVYGWAEGNLITSFFYFDDVLVDEGVNHPAGISLYVLQDYRLPDILRMPADPGEQDFLEWLNRVWGCTKRGQLVRLSERIQAFPGDMWAIGTKEGTYIEFDATSRERPRVVSARPYYMSHPREAYPGELRLFERREFRHSLKDWIQP